MLEERVHVVLPVEELKGTPLHLLVIGPPFERLPEQVEEDPALGFLDAEATCTPSVVCASCPPVGNVGNGITPHGEAIG